MGKPKRKIPATPALRALKGAGIRFSLHPYPYEDKGGTAAATRALGVDEHCVIKTLVMTENGETPFLVLMHGDREVSTKQLARNLSVKQIRPCDATAAQRHTGYQVGGISPFGIRMPLRVFVEASILDLPEIYINGGKRGLLVRMNPQDLVRMLDPTPVHAAQPPALS